MGWRSRSSGPAAAVATGVLWGLVEAGASARRSRLDLGAKELLVLAGLSIGIGVAVAGAAVLLGSLAGRRTQRGETVPPVAWAVGAVACCWALSVLLPLPVPDRSFYALPGGFAAAVLTASALGLAVGASLARWPRHRAVAGVAVAMALAIGRWPGAVRDGVPGSLPTGGGGADRPNVLLVTIDTLRADHVRAIGGGGSGADTPNLDRLAAEGVLFRSAWSPVPATGPAHLSILTGASPWSHGALGNGAAAEASIPRLPEVLRARGYRTAAFVSAYVLDRGFGMARGFDVYDDAFLGPPGLSDTSPVRLAWQLRVRLGRVDGVQRRGDRTVARVQRWLGRSPATPFLLWVHLYDPHGPYEPPDADRARTYRGDPRDPAHTSMRAVGPVAPYLEESLRGITDVDWVRAGYRGEVTFADRQVGRLLDGLSRAGLQDDTLVLLMSDHGESLGEHGYWFNHGDLLHEPDLRVPLMARWPGHIPAGGRIDTPVELVDVAPTVADLLGLGPWRGDGRSLRPLWQGIPQEPRMPAAICYDRDANRQAGRHRRVRARARDDRAAVDCRGEGRPTVYDVVADPGEVRPSTDPADVARLAAAVARRCEEVRAAGQRAAARDVGRVEIGVSDDERCLRLRALGYVGEGAACP